MCIRDSNKVPYNLPYRVADKLKRELKGAFGNPHIQRNFELQFLGKDNDKKLRQYLYETSYLDFIPETIITSFYDKFKNEDYVKYSHSVSQLLTLSLWHKLFYSS